MTTGDLAQTHPILTAGWTWKTKGLFRRGL